MTARNPLPLLPALLALGLCAPRARAQEAPGPERVEKRGEERVENRAGGPRCGSGETARIFRPGEFSAALERARREERALLIKGVAFGMDRLGATNPTKGHW